MLERLLVTNSLILLPIKKGLPKQPLFYMAELSALHF
jgi:hypothetical protein